MQEHIKRIHNGQKDKKCEICGKSGTLKKHNHTVHEGHKDCKCEFCGKSFSQAPSLKTHFFRFHKE